MEKLEPPSTVHSHTKNWKVKGGNHFSSISNYRLDSMIHFPWLVDFFLWTSELIFCGFVFEFLGKVKGGHTPGPMKLAASHANQPGCSPMLRISMRSIAQRHCRNWNEAAH